MLYEYQTFIRNMIKSVQKAGRMIKISVARKILVSFFYNIMTLPNQYAHHN